MSDLTRDLTGDFTITLNQSLKMEHIGTLAKTEDVLSPTIIPPFGILSPPARSQKLIEI